MITKEKIEKESNQWIPVTERLPEDGIAVLCNTSKFGEIGKGNDCLEILYYDAFLKTWANFDIDDFESNPDYFRITHWMPLPESPK
jgi:hypothetical protein